MITAVRIEGFQSHTASQLNFGPGLNVITGPSGGGKTAILRAIKWVAFNEPQGEAYVNVKVGEAAVALYLDNGAVITKRRKKGKTSYLLQMNEDDEGSLFEKSEVPEEIRQVLQIEKQTFGDFETALNFSFQLDPPFLLSETASAGAKILGKLAGTESVDLAIKDISKDTYSSRQERSNADKDIERLSGSMLSYAHIDDAKEALDVAELLLQGIEEGDKKFDNLRAYRTTYEQATRLLEDLGKKLDKLAVVPQLEEDLQDIEKAQRRYELLLDLYGTYDHLGRRLSNIAQDLLRYTEVGQASDLLEEVGKQAAKLDFLNSMDKDLIKYTDMYRKSTAVIDNIGDLFTLQTDVVLAEIDLSNLKDLKVLLIDYNFTEKARSRSQERLKTFDTLIEVDSTLNLTGAILTNLEHMQSLKAEYDAAVRNVENHFFDAEKAAREHVDTIYELEEAWIDAGDICPLCEQLHGRGTKSC